MESRVASGKVALITLSVLSVFVITACGAGWPAYIQPTTDTDGTSPDVATSLDVDAGAVCAPGSQVACLRLAENPDGGVLCVEDESSCRSDGRGFRPCGAKGAEAFDDWMEAEDLSVCFPNSNADSVK